MTKKTYTIQDNGQITLPVEWRRRYGLKKGDVVVYKETEEGLLISPKEAQVLRLLDELGEGLKAKGITLEELIESGREIRQELYEEKYARDAE
ncbi:MAG: AbrB/MazE/SpoVT family DNA-binding domain-containing protein [Candidatus Promineifilaceae bacterium]